MENKVTSFPLRASIQKNIQKRVEALQKGYRQNIGILGPEGFGKTQMLTALHRQLKGCSTLIPIYLDAQVLDVDHLVDRWLGGILSGFFLSQAVRPPDNFQSLMRAAEPLIPLTIERIRHIKKLLRQEKTAAGLREMFSLPGSLAQETGKKVVFIIDEFHCLENLPAADPFALLGREIMVEKNTLYLVSSSKPEHARHIFRDKLSLLFGNFEIFDLKPLGFGEVIDFLARRFPLLGFTAAQKKFLIRMTDGNPVYLELLADQFEILARSAAADDPISDSRLLEIFERELVCGKGRLYRLFERRVENCRRMAKDSAPYLRTLLAISRGRHKPLGIAAYIEKKTTDTKKILQRLVQEGMIQRCGTFFVLEDALFRFWLREVQGPRYHLYVPDDATVRQAVRETLQREFEKTAAEERVDITSIVEGLFKEFRNDAVELEGKKFVCPQFSEIAFRPTNGRVFPLQAKHSGGRWLCQIFPDRVREDDLAAFMEEIKKMRKKVQKRILISLGGIDQNAKLMAQEARIHIWDLRCFNALLDLYDQPKIIRLPENPQAAHEKEETQLEALAPTLSQNNG